MKQLKMHIMITDPRDQTVNYCDWTHEELDYQAKALRAVFLGRFPELLINEDEVEVFVSAELEDIVYA